MIKNRTIFTGDNLPIMRGMADESVDLVYLDPPFSTNRNYEIPVGNGANGTAFKDAWTREDTDDAYWGEVADEHPDLYTVTDAVGAAGGKRAQAYSIYMAIRLLEVRRILKDTGSVYLHCDPTMSHSLKLVMDTVFGGSGFRNEIIWSYDRVSHRDSDRFTPAHDIILFYAKGANNLNPSYADPKYFTRHARGWHTAEDAKLKKLLAYDLEAGKPAGIDLSKVGKVSGTKAGKPRLGDIWHDIPSLHHKDNERTGYPTQKPLALLRRIVKASSNEGDVVLDPFCGSATACLAAHMEGRRWIGIDISKLALDLIKSRMEKELNLFGVDVIHRTDVPQDREGNLLKKHQPHPVQQTEGVL